MSMSNMYNLLPSCGKRSSESTIKRQMASLNTPKSLRALADSSCAFVMIMNLKKEILLMNRPLINTLNYKNIKKYYGKRPGELFMCEKAKLEKDGCGASIYCQECGAFTAIFQVQKGCSTALHECRIQREPPHAPLDILVKTSSFKHNKSSFIICSMIDISNEKRRRVLERIFFHDLLNTMGCISGLAQSALETSENQATKDLLSSIYDASCITVDEVVAQKQLYAAEHNELPVNMQQVNARYLLSQLVSIYRKHDTAANKQIQMDNSSESIDFSTDAAILKRILANMLKNALEASEQEDAVSLGVCRCENNKVKFYVRNTAYIPFSIQKNIFARSFSTKGEGRGIGTYSIKLLGEQYLKGKVGFSSTKDQGTEFYIILDISNS